MSDAVEIQVNSSVDSDASVTCIQPPSSLADDRLKPQHPQPTIAETIALGSKGNIKAVMLPTAPAQPADKYPKLNPKTKEPELDKDGNKRPLFNGKNPSFLNDLGIPVIVAHSKFDSGAYPSSRQLKEFFKDSKTGIGFKFSSLNNIYAFDIDAKNFDSQADCDCFVISFILEYPQVGVWLEKTRSGGFRSFIRLKNQPEFKSFTHKLASGKLVGELLGVRGGKCDFAVLAPSSGYFKINRPENLEDIEEFNSIEDLGIFKHGSDKPEAKPQDKKTPVGESHFDQLLTTIQLTFDKLISKNNLTTYKGIYSENDDRSKLYVALARDVWGWENWLRENCPELPIENPDSFLVTAANNLGYSADDIEAKLKLVNRAECLPAIHYVGGDEDCRKRVSALTNTRKPFEVLTTIEETILMDTFGDGKGDWKVLFGGFYRYTGKGYWQLVDDSEIEQLICEDLRKCYQIKKTKDGYTRDFKFAGDKNKVSCLKFCRSYLWIKQPENNLRCFKNVTKNFTTGDTLEHSKEHYLTSLVPHDFVENADCPQVFLDFIESSYGLELLDLIRAIFSMFLDPNAIYGHFPHFVGESRSGKGTLLRLIEKLFDQNCITTPISLDVFSNEEKIHQYLSGKSLCLFKDLQGYQTKLGGFYEVIDNGSVQARPLFAPKSYNIKLNIRVAIASVEQLNLENAALGLASRIIPIPTKPVRGRVANHNLEKDLEAELANIISWALSMDKKQRDDLIKNSSKIESVAKMKKEQEIASNPVMGFADCSIIPVPGSTVSIHDLYSAYKAYCHVSGFKALSVNTFSHRVKQVFPDNFVKSAPKRIDGTMKRISSYLDNALLSNAFQKNDCYEFTCTPEFLIPGCLDLFKYEQEQPKQPVEPIQQPEQLPTVVVDKNPEVETAFSEVRENWKDPISLGRIISNMNPDIKGEVYKKMATPERRDYWHDCILKFEKYNNLSDAEILGIDEETLEDF